MFSQAVSGSARRVEDRPERGGLELEREPAVGSAKIWSGLSRR
jgi:hypothetical protein